MNDNDIEQVAKELKQNIMMEKAIDTLAMNMYAYYCKLIEQGFNDMQAFQLTRDWQVSVLNKAFHE